MKMFQWITLLGTVAFATLTFLPSAARAQSQSAPPTQTTEPAAPVTWATAQLITSTVHDAWVLSVRDEKTFASMVSELIPLSLTNRGITLPDDAGVGQRLGQLIKQYAKADTDQLLYVVVDRAVRKTAASAVTTTPAKP